MSFKAVLFINDEKRNILNASQLFSRFTDINGRPTTKPVGDKLEFSIESTGNDSFFYHNMFSPTTKCKGEVVFYKRDGLSTLFKMEFANAQILNLTEKFDAINNIPLHINISIGWGIMKMRGVIFEETWNPNNPFLKIEETKIEQEDEDEEIDLKFIAKFKRPDSYKGEFGFDWMRNNYETICEDYNKLKKEYTPTKIHNQEYFVPWLSMFPKQENVKLKLVITEIEGTVKDTDFIKLSAKSGIKFEPNRLKVSEANGKEITVICENPLNNDVIISLIDKDNEEVGKLNILKNNEDLVLKIKLIKVKGNEVDNKYNQQTFSNMSDKWVSELFGNLSTKYLNQALIKIEEDSIEEMVIDVDKYIEEGALDAFVIDGKRGIPRYNKGFDQKLYDDFVSKNGDYKGIIFFLSSMHQKGQELGHAFPYPREINYILMTPTAIGSSDISYGHELGHTLGLHHPWEKSTIYNTRLSKIQERVEYLKKYLESNKQYSDDTKIKDSNKTIGDVRIKINTELSDLEKEKKDRNELSPIHTFDKASTENIMDYNGYITTEGETKYNPHNKGITFWKWQWQIVNKEIKKYHGK